jgi:hypothetical protein
VRYVEIVFIKARWKSAFLRWIFPVHMYALLRWKGPDGNFLDDMILVDPHLGQVEITPIHLSDLAYRTRYTCELDRLLVEYPEDVPLTQRIVFEPLTCVTVIKRILGIRDWRIQTPKQLKRYLDAR